MGLSNCQLRHPSPNKVLSAYAPDASETRSSSRTRLRSQFSFFLTESLIFWGSKTPTPGTVPSKLQPSSQSLATHPR